MRTSRAKAAALPPITPRLERLPAAQRRLWPELSETPPEFFLAGGTGIAVQIGHRQSQDFDFFSYRNFDTEKLLGQVAYLRDAKILDRGSNTLTVTVTRRGSVKLSFFGLPKLRRVAPPRTMAGTTLKVANLIDLAGFKVAVIYQRQDPKDYLDIDAILNSTDIRLVDALAAARKIYGEQFNPLISLKALGHFGDPDLESISRPVQKRLRDAIAGLQYEDLATFARADLSPR